MVKLLAFSGSGRVDSYNQKLAKIAANEASAAGAEVNLINLADFPMPIFNADLEQEQGPNEYAQAFKQLLIESDGFLLASPEYNSSFSPLFKNAIDWASRSYADDEPPLAAFRNKTAGVMSTSPGAMGGIRGLVMVRMLLGNIGMQVFGRQHCVGGAAKAFDENGQLTKDHDKLAIKNLATDFVRFTERLHREF
jgi:chromate reductase, NAD(P)H dehydrogenase (quinone)